jgi:predicted dienelactone hydrolase
VPLQRSGQQAWELDLIIVHGVPLGSLAVQFLDSLRGVKDCPVTGANLPLVIVSRGRGGWFGGHDDVEQARADAGFVVAAINHPGDNGNDRSQS